MRVSCRPDEAPFPLAYLALPPPPSDLTLPLTPPLYFTPAPLTSPQVMKKKDLIRKNMVESVNNERNILALANNPFVVSGGRLCGAYPPPFLHGGERQQRAQHPGSGQQPLCGEWWPPVCIPPPLPSWWRV